MDFKCLCSAISDKNVGNATAPIWPAAVRKCFRCSSPSVFPSFLTHCLANASLQLLRKQTAAPDDWVTNGITAAIGETDPFLLCWEQKSEAACLPPKSECTSLRNGAAAFCNPLYNIVMRVCWSAPHIGCCNQTDRSKKNVPC